MEEGTENAEQNGLVTDPDTEPDAPRPEPEKKQIYLRTVYPLNPGIPHFVDVPDSW